jgi:hypothetical protein
MTIIFQVGAAAPMQRNEALALTSGAWVYLAIPAGAKQFRVSGEAGGGESDFDFQIVDADPATVFGPYFKMRTASALCNNPSVIELPAVLQDGATPPGFLRFKAYAVSNRAYVQWYATG